MLEEVGEGAPQREMEMNQAGARDGHRAGKQELLSQGDEGQS